MMAQPDFWEKNSSNQAIQKERASIIDALSPWKNEQKELDDVEILLQLLEEQEDEQETRELLEKIQKTEEASSRWNSGGCWRRERSKQRDREHQCRGWRDGGPGLD